MQAEPSGSPPLKSAVSWRAASARPQRDRSAAVAARPEAPSSTRAGVGVSTPSGDGPAVWGLAPRGGLATWLRVMRLVGQSTSVEPVRQETLRLLEEGRVVADVEVIVRADPNRPFADIVAEHSAATDLTVLGMQRPSDVDTTTYGETLNAAAEAAGTLLLVHNGEPQEAALT